MPEAPQPIVGRIGFAPFEIDVRTGELRREGTSVPLPEIVQRMLLLLMEERGNAVPGDSLAERLGANSASLDIPSVFSSLRQALGDDDPGNPRFVSSSPEGYRFIGSAEPSQAAPPGSAAGQSASGQAMKPLPEEAARYTLFEAIGAGGMGEVFRGRDLRLQRDVAIKFLPPWLANDPLGLARFHREARAAASLNHPNVLAVYDLAAIDGAPCLVSELLEGRTLRARLNSGSVPPFETLTLAEQIISGLHAAHEKGVVHRDLKPENIFITADGRVKILDFGLAKQLQEPPSAGSAPTALTTAAGAVLGTVGYTSPEQARGEVVDARSDLFAFGAVFYELLTGRRPFHRGTQVETTRALLTDDPPPPSALNPAVSPLCDAIVAKALEKERELRYQSTAEVKADILRARRELTGTGSQPAMALQPPGRRRWSRPARLGAAVALLAAVAASVGAGLWLFGGRDALPSFEASKVTIGLGTDSDPALSPDGNFLAYASDEGGDQDIWLVDLRDASATIRRTIEPGPDRKPVWMPDGAGLLFVSERDGKPGVWRMPALSGPATRLLADADDVAVSPDGKQIAFVRPGPSGYMRVAVAPLSDLNRVTFLTGDGDGLWDHREPAWSPDGGQLCYRGQMSLWAVELGGGRPRQIAAGNYFLLNPAWSPDARHVYVSSNREGTDSIWRAPIKGGELRRVTSGTGPEKQPAVSADGRILAFANVREDILLVIRDMVTGEERTWSTAAFETMPSLSPDGKRVYFASRAHRASNQLWSLRLEDGAPEDQPTQLTRHEGQVAHPSCSPDGRWVAYFVIENGGSRRSVWVVPATGGQPTRVTEGPLDTVPAWAADGKSLFFDRGEADGISHVWRVAIEEGHAAGTPRQLTSGRWRDAGAVSSPDGSLIAFSRSDIAGKGNAEVWVMPAEGGDARRLTSGAQVQRVQWDGPGGQSLLVTGKWGGRWLEMRRVALRNGKDEGVLPQGAFGPIDEVPDFSLSGDGRLLAFARFERQGNIWIARADRGRF